MINHTIVSDFGEHRRKRLAPKSLSVALACLPCLLLLTSCEDESGSRKAGAEEIRSLREQIASTRADIEKIQTSFGPARAIEPWVLASYPIQPLIVAISRSVSSPSSLTQLTLAREADSPRRVTISLELLGAPRSQMESILKAIHNLGLSEQSVTQTNSDEAIKFDAVLVWKDSDREGNVQGPSDPRPATNSDADEDGPALRARLKSLQEDVRSLTDQASDAARFAQDWRRQFFLTTEADDAEAAISMKLRESELAVPFSSFKIVDCSPLYPAWSKAIPQVLQGECVIEDNYTKCLNALGMMERDEPSLRISRVSISCAGRDKCRFDLVLEVPLLNKSPN